MTHSYDKGTRAVVDRAMRQADLDEFATGRS
jgi:hypothetical protein